MKLTFLTLSGLLVCLVTAREDDPVKEARLAVNAAINKFTVDLYQACRAGGRGNAVVSPLGASLVLAPAWLGAGGDAARQLGQALHFTHGRDLVARGYADLLHSLQDGPGRASVRVASGLLAKEGARLKAAFARAANASFGATARGMDFASGPEAARRAVNAWAQSLTRGAVRDLVPPGLFTEESSLVLVNTLYLNASWQEGFQEEDTFTDTFYVTPNEKKDVPMMHGYFQTYSKQFPELDALGISLTFSENKVHLTMVLLLPNKIDGLDTLEASLANFTMEEFTNQDDWELVELDVALPKFRIESTHYMKNYLQKLGVTDLFIPFKASLTDIADEDIYVNRVVHKTFIEVNENGTDGTESGGSFWFFPTHRKVPFKADHPFLFLVAFDKNILLLGRVQDPDLQMSEI